MNEDNKQNITSRQQSGEAAPEEPKKIITPDGDEISYAEEKETKRVLERKQEDRAYVPVIVKRTDETFRHPDDILETAIHEGLEQHARPLVSLFLSAIAAGMILCFTVMAVAVVSQFASEFENPWLERLTIALFYPLGFVLCILSRTQLFTEHTATAVYPVLDEKSDFKGLIMLWLTVIAGNLVGGLISAQLLILADPVIQAEAGYIMIAKHLVHFDSVPLILSAVLAGWLMALGAWIVLSTHSTLSQIVSIYIVTFLIGIGGLHHSIAGSIEMIVGYLISDEFTLVQAVSFIGHALLGNMIGGSLFVAVLNYGHIRHSQRSGRNTTKMG
ncbi:formate/nitrite transporter family protein [Flocculibacter collagenilyticus]|uniref:formate/nitrite transporter family protein n=1 Tax=Flocculibacter collagenilyticus TaxID=2744479 RepID=UPI0018F477F5|nr:formate/nitrite transporter family protein [Flocculibacter collagenilyticus]